MALVRRARLGGVLVALAMVASCGDGGTDEETPSSEPSSGTSSLSVVCTQVDASSGQCQLLQLVVNSPQSTVPVRTTLDLRDPQGAPSSGIGADDVSALLDDIDDPRLNVIMDDDTVRALSAAGVSDGVETLTQLHPERCRVVTVGRVKVPVCL